MYAWVDLGDGRSVYRKVETARPKRSDLPSPMICTDTMPDTQSMLDGKYYSSKSALRATYRQAGVEEVGNDPQRFRRKPKVKVDRKAIKDSLQKATARFERGERSGVAE